MRLGAVAIATVLVLAACQTDGGPLEASDAKTIARESLAMPSADESPLVEIDGHCALVTFDDLEPVVLGASDGHWFVVSETSWGPYDPSNKNCRENG
jgi:hypothetical protein